MSPLDLEDVVHRARAAYAIDELDPQTALGGGDTYSVRAREGVVSVVPRHYPGGDPAVRIEGSPLALETISIARGTPFDLPAAKTAVLPDGALSIDRGVAEERLANNASGVEQSWYFDQAPPGGGDLVVRARISGQTYAGESNGGLHFLDENTGIGIRYGAATWIDASGVMANVPVHFVDGAVELTVPERVVEASAFPAVLDPTLYPEVALVNPAVGPSAYSAELPSVTSDGVNYFVVWADMRRGSSDIFGARIRMSDAALLDPLGIELVTTGFEEAHPQVAFNGTNYVMTYQDHRGANYDLYALMLYPDGTPAGAPLSLATGLTGDQQNAAIGMSGTTAFVTWQDGRSGVDKVYFARIDSAGTLLDGSGVPVNPTGELAERIPGITCGPAQCLIAFQVGATENIAAMRVGSDGVLLDAAPFAVGSSQGRDLTPAVGFDGTNYLVAWRAVSDIRANRVVAETGEVLDGATGFIVSAALSQQQRPAVAFDGTGYFVVWQDMRTDGVTWDIYGARVTTAGAVLDASGKLISNAMGSQMFPELIFVDGKFFAVWQDARYATNNVYGARIFPSGSVFDNKGISISRSATRQFAAAAAFDGYRYVVVYADSRAQGGGNYDIRAMRVSRRGDLLDMTGVTVASGVGNQTAADIAWNGSEHLVVWRDERAGFGSDIRGTLLDSALRPLPPGEIVISAAPGDQLHPRVAYNAGTNMFLVVWDDSRNGSAYDVYGTRVDAYGTVLEPIGIAISTFDGPQERPVVASDGARWLVAWTDGRPPVGEGGEHDIHGNIVNANGTVALVGMDLAICVNGAHQGGPRLVYNGGTFFALWADSRGGVGNTDIYGTEIDIDIPHVANPNGVPLVTSPLAENRAVIAVMGDKYFVAWEQTMSGGSRIDIYGRLFNFDGTPADATPFFIASDPANEANPTIAVHNATNALVSYQHYDDSPELRSERVHARRVQFP